MSKWSRLFRYSDHAQIYPQLQGTCRGWIPSESVLFGSSPEQWRLRRCSYLWLRPSLWWACAPGPHADGVGVTRWGLEGEGRTKCNQRCYSWCYSESRYLEDLFGCSPWGGTEERLGRSSPAQAPATLRCDYFPGFTQAFLRLQSHGSNRTEKTLLGLTGLEGEACPSLLSQAYMVAECRGAGRCSRWFPSWSLFLWPSLGVCTVPGVLRAQGSEANVPSFF